MQKGQENLRNGNSLTLDKANANATKQILTQQQQKSMFFMLI